ncbi:tRNA-dihydrouridine synthase 2 [Coemansia guatemalensis]|uniref:tRNA-dihydrouridine synthase 2 n=1 Tax=Coemansia guatemalensis TaxID=2761395 RepID=A0A9W8LVN7_9FUNG|nr:tRNA-dihydrouridine synthase 2 [Coemansia guatemalensis]
MSIEDRYRNGFFLAPMVRVGTLPLRLLSLHYGADLVWTDENIDRGIIGCERVVDEKTGVVAFIKDGKDMFATHPDERDKVIFQIGTADPTLALAAAKVVEQDVAGIDLNCGCPKKFSIQGGMGAALLQKPDQLCAILETLVKNISKPVSCKIRVLDDEEQTLALVRRIAATGIAALTVHCRTRDMRPREKAMWHRLNSIVDEVAPLPVILNGDVFSYEDVQRARDSTGATSVMTARGAIENPSIFRAEGPLPVIDVAVEYVKYAVRVSSPFRFTKYTILQIYPDKKGIQYRGLQSSRGYEQMCAAVGIADFYYSEGARLINDRADPEVAKSASAKRQHPSLSVKAVDPGSSGAPCEDAALDSEESPTKRTRTECGTTA